MNYFNNVLSQRLLTYYLQVLLRSAICLWISMSDRCKMFVWLHASCDGWHAINQEIHSLCFVHSSPSTNYLMTDGLSLALCFGWVAGRSSGL